jgi:site-specific DNA-methyltransferase (adenine-specific)
MACKHPGCINHITHPCEVCGCVAGKRIVHEIICGDSLEVVKNLPYAKVIFADIPDNLNVDYEGFKDKTEINTYVKWVEKVIDIGLDNSDIFWLSYNTKYGCFQNQWLLNLEPRHRQRFFRMFYWRFTFGQHRQTDCAQGLRYLLRLKKEDVPIYPDAIRVQSARQKAGDKRADPRGRVPDDVWEFPRVVGNAKERRKWHPNQHPEALIERILKFSAVPGDTVIDMFAGTGTVHRVAKRLGMNSYSIDISPFYCQKIKEEDNGQKMDMFRK